MSNFAVDKTDRNSNANTAINTNSTTDSINIPHEKFVSTLT